MHSKGNPTEFEIYFSCICDALSMHFICISYAFYMQFICVLNALLQITCSLAKGACNGDKSTCNLGNCIRTA